MADTSKRRGATGEWLAIVLLIALLAGLGLRVGWDNPSHEMRNALWRAYERASARPAQAPAMEKDAPTPRSGRV